MRGLEVNLASVIMPSWGHNMWFFGYGAAQWELAPNSPTDSMPDSATSQDGREKKDLYLGKGADRASA